MAVRTKPARRRADAIEGLKRVPLFSTCSQRELRSIAGVAKEVHFAAGDSIVHEGKPGVGMHVILEGETKATIGGRTRRRMGPGAFFGEMALLDGGPRSASVVAESDVRAMVIPAWGFRKLLKDNPSLMLKMLEEMARRMRDASPTVSH